MVFAIVPILVMVIGLVMWAIPGNAFRQSMGEKMFTCGLLVSLFVSAHYSVRIP